MMLVKASEAFSKVLAIFCRKSNMRAKSTPNAKARVDRRTLSRPKKSIFAN